MGDNTDIFCPQYPGVKTLQNYASKHQPKTFISSEYSHAMGNSNGNLMDLWDVIYKKGNDQLQGGYIWDWIDQALVKKDKDGSEFWAYGGDFGKGMPNNHNFVCNGLISADYTPHPATHEVKYAYQYVRFAQTGDKYIIHNYHDFVDLSDYEISWLVSGNGEKMFTGKLEKFNLAPHTEKEVSIPVPAFTAESGVEYFIDFSVKLKKDKPFRPVGFEVAHDQFKLDMYREEIQEQENRSPLELAETQSGIIIAGDNFKLKFDKLNGMLTSYEINGIQLLQKGPQINFWRPPNDNDKGNQMIDRLGVWRETTNSAELKNIKASQPENGKVIIITTFNLAPVKSEETITYMISGNGKVEIRTAFATSETGLPDMPRFGLKWQLPVNFDNLKYFGRGPQENYIDRNRSAFVGIYSGKVVDQYFKYVRPQENGYKTDVRWFELRNQNEVGIRISGEPLVGFSALNNPIEDFDMIDMDDYRHTNDIVKKDGVFVCCDFKMMGVAGDNSWGARPYPEYCITAKNYEFSFTVEPVF